jgi:hypothetical protein
MTYTLQMVQRICIFFQEVKFAFKVLVCCFLLFSLSPKVQWSYVITLHASLALVFQKPLNIFFLILHRYFLGYYAYQI